jgi:hypothetical protein
MPVEVDDRNINTGKTGLNTGKTPFLRSIAPKGELDGTNSHSSELSSPS